MQGKKIVELEKKQKNLMRKINSLDTLCRGSVVTLRQSCTNENCKKCASGEKHPQVYLSLSKNSKTKLVYLSRKKRDIAKGWTDNYKKLKQLIEDITEVNLELLKKY